MGTAPKRSQERVRKPDKGSLEMQTVKVDQLASLDVEARMRESGELSDGDAEHVFGVVAQMSVLDEVLRKMRAALAEAERRVA